MSRPLPHFSDPEASFGRRPGRDLFTDNLSVSPSQFGCTEYQETFRPPYDWTLNVSAPGMSESTETFIHGSRAGEHLRPIYQDLTDEEFEENLWIEDIFASERPQGKPLRRLPYGLKLWLLFACGIVLAAMVAVLGTARPLQEPPPPAPMSESSINTQYRELMALLDMPRPVQSLEPNLSMTPATRKRNDGERAMLLVFLKMLSHNERGGVARGR